jgi:hypothetical protein
VPTTYPPVQKAAPIEGELSSRLSIEAGADSDPPGGLRGLVEGVEGVNKSVKVKPPAAYRLAFDEMTFLIRRSGV